MQAELIISERGRESLASSGISSGWLKAWILGMGAKEVRIYALQDHRWQTSKTCWQIFYGNEDELIRVALKHGRKITMTRQFKRSLSGTQRIELHNPSRFGWHYATHGSIMILLPLGDIVTQRDKWLFLLSKKKKSVYIAHQTNTEVYLESGLGADLRKNNVEYLNHNGLLPEEQVYALLLAKKLKLRTAESCTGGAIAQRLIRLSGASHIFDCAWVTYSNDAKIRLLHVDSKGLAKHGAVSASIVEAMARSGIDHEHLCLAVSGVAGPTGGTESKPVGTVWLALATHDGRCLTELLQLHGSRAEVQNQVVIAALAKVIQYLQD